MVRCCPWRENGASSGVEVGGRGGEVTRESTLHRSIFHALWLPYSRGRRSSVHRGPPEVLFWQKGARLVGGVAGSSQSSLVSQL